MEDIIAMARERSRGPVEVASPWLGGEVSEVAITELYEVFRDALARCRLDENSVDFALFERKVREQRERARASYGVDSLRMRVEIARGQPVLVFAPDHDSAST